MVETSLLINALTIHATQFASNPAADAALRAEFFAAKAQAEADGTPYATFVKERGNTSSSGPGMYYRCFATRDGGIAIGALSASLRAKVRAVLGIDHNRDQAGYDPNDPQQQALDAEVVAKVEALIKTQTSDYWEDAFSRGGVPASRINFVQELLQHPQVVANDYVVELEHDLTGPQWTPAPPWKMSATPPQAQGASPPLGRDTDEILASAGYTPDEIFALRKDGVVR
jgi:crotonobetainyl-CoA:carnitine CoA-transferase CaiB-like acyl-CoA transferase